ncbi:Propanediol dehydratase small subunit [Urinicoccus massiliensis]|uniref:Propanediol dehydratase small subunit n=1 Tax=Urinicoccus massiliensis TaxID=1723382 RepID=A0A8H2M785_9FIRM|nr:diol dehydratase small subunit [Urinicoccus massiliensis]VFB17273.1 Propanediol dehydratase small subunit [Urinicoccus massiliensis]
MDSKKLEEMIREVMASMETGGEASVKTEANTASFGPVRTGQKLSVDDYPLGEKSPELIETPTGRKLDDLTLEKLVNGEIHSKDLKIRPETLYMQAEIAEAANRKAFARNLRRAAELIPVEDDKLLDIYNALRPNRSSKQELLDIAKDLEDNYKATINAALVRNAAEVYEKRDILRRD